jgi:eukaryotic-like serine/threonine-protein kinase
VFYRKAKDAMMTRGTTRSYGCVQDGGPVLAPPAGVRVGDRIGSYVLRALLGQGSMGAVFLGEHGLIGRKAAIKVLRPELARHPSLVKRFFNEARAANAVGHPGIVDMLDVGTLPDGIPYLVMEYLPGDSLASRITAHGQLPVEQALLIAWQVASVLAAAHDKGIVHRDLKPANLFLVPAGAGHLPERIKVLDFGIAKLGDDAGPDQSRTFSGQLTGTPIYMAPEQWRGAGEEVDHRTDVYALGIILHEMLCGAPPFVGGGYGDTMLLHMTQPPPAPSARNAQVPAALDALVLRALAKNREDRFSSMRQLQEALAAVWASVPAFGPVARLSSVPGARSGRSFDGRTPDAPMEVVGASPVPTPPPVAMPVPRARWPFLRLLQPRSRDRRW